MTQNKDSRGRPTEATSRPNLVVLTTDDASKTLLFPASGVSYHSAAGAASETQHVYINSSGLPNHWSAGRDTSVLELGLGTSMAMLMTIDQALSKKAPIFYLALETDWLEPEIIRQLELQNLLNHRELVEDWLAVREQWEANGKPRVTHWSPRDSIEVEIHFQDIKAWIDESVVHRFDAIYFDPFSHDTAPELWSSKVFAKMKELLRTNGRLTTYSCARIVRDNIEVAGLHPEKVKGPVGGKRESLIATHVDANPTDTNTG